MLVCFVGGGESWQNEFRNGYFFKVPWKRSLQKSVRRDLWTWPSDFPQEATMSTKSACKSTLCWEPKRVSSCRNFETKIFTDELWDILRFCKLININIVDAYGYQMVTEQQLVGAVQKMDKTKQMVRPSQQLLVGMVRSSCDPGSLHYQLVGLVGTAKSSKPKRLKVWLWRFDSQWLEVVDGNTPNKLLSKKKRDSRIA